MIVSQNDKEIILKFPKGANGFKFSANHKNRLYFYPDSEMKMDMVKIPPGVWKVERANDLNDEVYVKLIAV